MNWGVISWALLSIATVCPVLAADDQTRASAADKAVFGFMAVCVLERDAAVRVIDAHFDNMTNIPKADLPEGVLAGLLLTSSAGTFRVVNDSLGQCALVAGSVDGERLQTKFRERALDVFRRAPHGRLCEVDAESYQTDAGSQKRMYVVTFPSNAERRFLLDATVWDRVNPAGIQAVLSMVPTRRECPQS